LPADAVPNQVFIRGSRMHADHDLVQFPFNLTDVADVWMKGNVNTVAPLRIANLRETNVLVRGTSATTGLTFHELDEIVFASQPTTGRWLRGQVIWYPAPAGSHALGLVCITPGPASNNTAKWDVIGSPALSTSTVTRQMATAGTTAEQYLLAGATQPTFSRRQDGQEKYGAGGSTAPDITIDRMGPGSRRQIGASKGSVAMELRAENVVGDTVAGDIEYRGTDRGSTVYRLLSAVAGAVASRFVALRAGADRDGNKLPLNLDVQNAAGANVTALQCMAGADAGSVAIAKDLKLTAPTTAAAATAGAAALPAAPVGFVRLTIGSTNYKLPYYAE
ncbi:hypothetical protein, partial [Longimicrobium sp.]|uniref:hypothetical protein n=1 Tax=Longimicrobium sp. TaxID=2029185 RepID=UPI002F958FAF